MQDGGSNLALTVTGEKEKETGERISFDVVVDEDVTGEIWGDLVMFIIGTFFCLRVEFNVSAFLFVVLLRVFSLPHTKALKGRLLFTAMDEDGSQ